MEVKHFDFFDVSELKGAEKTPQGFLRAPIYATRTGVFKYVLPDGKVRRELRHPEEVFKPESLATLSGIPITYRHPKNMVAPSNAKATIVGYTGDQVNVVDNKFIKLKGTVTDGGAIEKVVSGEAVQVSCGYVADVIEEAGIFEGETYDCVQKNIIYNHVAIVERGRAGEEVKFRLDSDQAILFDQELVNNIVKGDTMTKIKIGDADYEVSDELKKAFDGLMKSQKDEMEGLKKQMKDGSKEKKDSQEQIDKLQAKYDGLATEKEELVSKLEEAKAEKKLDSKQIHTFVQERKGLEEVANKILSEEIKAETVKLDELDNESIKKEVVKKVAPNLTIEEKSDAYIEARFDGIKDSLTLHVDSLTKALEAKSKKESKEGKKDGEDKTDAREKARIEASEAWKKPLTVSKNK